jgi:hypothetical protein
MDKEFFDRNRFKFPSHLRKIQLFTRKKISADLLGLYGSAFRGNGITFSELREYQPGDELRTIHWKATARSGKTYVKSFTEERQNRILFVVDVSSSMKSLNFSRIQSGHFQTGASLSSALQFVATVSYIAQCNGDRIGLFTFDTEGKKYIKPGNPRFEFFRILEILIKEENRTTSKTSTNFIEAVYELNKKQKKRCTIFLISDFFSKDIDKGVKALSLRHDLIGVHTVPALLDKSASFTTQQPAGLDKQNAPEKRSSQNTLFRRCLDALIPTFSEEKIIKAFQKSLILCNDSEAIPEQRGISDTKNYLIDLSSKNTYSELLRKRREREDILSSVFTKNKASLIHIDGDDVIAPLVKFMQKRMLLIRN